MPATHASAKLSTALTSPLTPGIAFACFRNAVTRLANKGCGTMASSSSKGGVIHCATIVVPPKEHGVTGVAVSCQRVVEHRQGKRVLDRVSLEQRTGVAAYSRTSSVSFHDTASTCPTAPTCVADSVHVRSRSVPMNRDQALTACSDHAGAVEGFPFGDGVAVFKVGGKIFAMVSLGDRPAQVSLKCDPDLAFELRSRYDAVAAGYHLNKTHWNTVTLDGSIPTDEVADMIDDSYTLVLSTLRQIDREKLASGGH